MNDALVMEDLRKWMTDEAFFRDYYEAKRDGRPVEELLQRPDVAQSDKDAALDPLTIDTQMTENRFFAEGRNVLLIKHPRYFPFFTHRHAFFEMLYVMQGSCEQVIEERTQKLREGDLCILAPNVTHGIRVFDDSIVLNILIRHSTFEDIFLHSIRDRSQISLFFLGNLFEKAPVHYLLYHTASDEEMRRYILNMYTEQTLADAYSDRIICSLVTIFFTQLTRRYGKSVEVPEQPKNASPYRDEMMAYILDNVSTVTLAELADHFHFAVPYCSKLVKSIAGCSFSDLITRIRLQQGENLLSHTQMNIMDISERIGYKNPETFIRAFARFYGMSPSQYRRSSLPPQSR